MQKAEAQQANVRNQAVAKKVDGNALATAQINEVAQLEAMIESSPQIEKMGNMVAMMNGAPAAASANPATAAQRRIMERVTNGSQPATQRMVDLIRNNPQQLAAQKFSARINNSPMMVAQRKHGEGLFGVAQRVGNEETLQGKFASESPVQFEQEAAAKPNNTGLPDNLKSGIENLSGVAMDNVKVHYNSSQPAQLNALAYAQGTDIHVAPGQEKHLPHEAWHVVQQAQGRVRPTMQMKDGVPVNDDQGLEREADLMGGHALTVMDAQKSMSDPIDSRIKASKFNQASSFVQRQSVGIGLDHFDVIKSTGAAASLLIQQVRDIPTGGKVFEQSDANAKRIQCNAVLQKLQLKLDAAKDTPQAQIIAEQIEKLTAMIAKYDLAPNTEAFLSVMPEQAPAMPHVLHIDLEFGDYHVGDEVAHGAYQFVILVSDPSRVLMAKGTGHQSIAGSNPVYYAGTAYFAIGDLVRWNNDTGHYRTDVEHAQQAEIPRAGGLPYLPMNRFEEFQR